MKKSNKIKCTKDDLLGKGSYGHVYGCQYLDYPNIKDICYNDIPKGHPCNINKKSKNMAIKLFHKSTHRKTKRDYWNEEINSIKPLICLRNINKKYFSLPIGSCTKDKNFYIQSNNDGNDIYDYISNKSSIPNTHKKYFFNNILKHITQIYKGLMSLHIHNLVHLDIKPENILFSYENKMSKIADFGFLTKLNSNTKYSIKGSPLFQLPEDILIKNKKYFLRTSMYRYDKKNYKLYNWCKSDIYAMSIVIKEILESKNKRYISASDSEILQLILLKSNTEILENIHNSIQILLLISRYTNDKELDNWISNTFKSKFNKKSQHTKYTKRTRRIKRRR